MDNSGPGLYPQQDLNNWRRVSEWVDIAAPRAEVFTLLLNLERRMQLSPLWGLSKVECLDPNYPAVGSRCHVQFVKGSPVEYDIVITELVPDRKLAYRLEAPQKTEVTWSLHDSAQGTRLTYTEAFWFEAPEQTEERVMSGPVKDIGSTLVQAFLLSSFKADPSGQGEKGEGSQGEERDFVLAVQGVVKGWLKNIQRYAELSARRQRMPDQGLHLSKYSLVLWLLDHFYLKLRNDQRKLVQVILFMQAISLVTFVMAVLAYGLVSLTHLAF